MGLTISKVVGVLHAHTHKFLRRHKPWYDEPKFAIHSVSADYPSCAQVFGRLFSKKEMRILMVGLDAAGKTTILYKLKVRISAFPIKMYIFLHCIKFVLPPPPRPLLASSFSHNWRYDG